MTTSIKKIRFLALIGIVGILLGAVAVAQFKDRDTIVPVETNWAWRWDSDPIPVSNTLHEYKRCKGCSKYLISGKSITFTFPKSFYAFINNQKGGPQDQIRLALNRNDLSPLSKKALELERNRKISLEIRRELERDIRESNIDIAIYSNAYESGLLNYGGGRLAGDKLAHPLGSKCGVNFGLSDRKPINGFSGIDLDNQKRDMLGVFVNNEKFGSQSGVVCVASLKNCEIHTQYHGFRMKFRIEKVDFCNWPRQLAIVSKFLDQNTTRLTEIQK